MRRMGGVVALAAGCVVAAAVQAEGPAPPPEAPMTFEAAHTGGNCDSCAWVAAEGRITDETPERFRRFLQEPPYAKAVLRLHSPGGDVGAAIELGRELRSRGFRTVVGRTRTRTEHGHEERAPGVCASACAYLFLGGETRDLPEGSILGVHRFRFADPDVRRAIGRLEDGLGISADQVLTGMLAGYVDEMGVDPELVIAAARTPSDRMSALSREDLGRYGVITPEPAWSGWRTTRDGGSLIYRAWYAGVKKRKTAAIRCADGAFQLNVAARGEVPTDDAGLREAVSPSVAIGGRRRRVPEGSFEAAVGGGTTRLGIDLYPGEVREIAAGAEISVDAGVPRAFGTLFLPVEPPALPDGEAGEMIDLMRRACARG